MGCSLGSPPLCVLRAVSRRVPWNADGKPLDKINSRGAPSSLVSKDKETPVWCLSRWGRRRRADPHSTRDTWQPVHLARVKPASSPFSRSGAHEEQCSHVLAREQGSRTPPSSPLPAPQAHPRRPVLRIPRVWPARAELLAPHCGEVLAETPRKKAGYSVSLSPGRPVTARPCRRPSQPPAHCGSHHGTALPATAPNSGEGPATVCDQRSHSGH